MNDWIFIVIQAKFHFSQVVLTEVTELFKIRVFGPYQAKGMIQNAGPDRVNVRICL